MSVWNPSVQRTFADEQAALDANIHAASTGFNSVIHAGLGVQGSVHRGAHVAAGMGASLKTTFAPPLPHIDKLIAAAMPTQIATPGEAIAAYVADTMSLEEATRCAQLAGVALDHFASSIAAARRKPEVVELGVIRNRELINDNEYSGALRAVGFTDNDEKDWISDLRFEVPGPADLVRFAVRHVFEPDLIAEFGYDDEYRPILDAFHHAQGVDYPIFTGPLKEVVGFTEAENNFVPGHFAQLYTEAQLPEPTWARAYWWSHWILPSPTQGYEMFFRLDPTRDKSEEPEWMRSQDFDLEHLRLLLRANDYPPYWRDKLAAIAYRAPNLRFLRVQLQTKTITRDQAVSQLRQMGFSPSYAAHQADALIAQLADQEAAKLLKLVNKDINAGWDIGLVTDEELRSTYVDAGIDLTEADTMINAAVFSRNVTVAKELIRELKKSYLAGKYDWPQTATFLTQVGVNARRIAEYKVVWDTQRQLRRKELSQAQYRKAVLDGGLTVPQYAARLRNLGYDDNAIGLLLHEVRLAVTERETKALKQLAAESQKTSKARLDALKALDRQQRQLQADLAKHGTPTQLRTWYCDGDISDADVTARLKALGWPQEDIDRLLGECDDKRAKIGLPPYTEEAPGAQA